MAPKVSDRARRGPSLERPSKKKQALKHAPTRPPVFHRSSSDFCTFVDSEAQPGCDLFVEANEGPRYIPFCALRRYWTRNKIGELLRDQNLYFTIDTILTRYLRTFSLLVYTGQVHLLAKFTDHNLNDAKLPLSSYPSEWPQKSEQFRGLFESVSGEQWMFFPLAINSHDLQDVRLDDRVVIPILPGGQNRIAHGDAAAVYFVKVHDRCNNPGGIDAARTCHRSFALKTYHTEKSTYENEIKALRTFTNFPSPNIVKYEGSFRQHGTCSIVMECVEEGNLDAFFKRTQPPEISEVALFWKSMSQVLTGLERIHHLAGGNQEVFGIHEDIKPDNILISTKDDAKFDFTPKIVDFGLFSRVTRSTSSSSTAMGKNTQGNQMYSSPESSHNVLYRQRGPSMVTTKADIFAMAAVFSSACAWVAGGVELQQCYDHNREACHDAIPRFHGTAYKWCFHDGQQCIDAVYDMHREIRGICEDRHDHITPAVLDIIEKRVFHKQEPAERSAARDIYSDLANLLCGASEVDERGDDSIFERTDTDNNMHTDAGLARLGKGMTVKQLASFRTLKEGKEKLHFSCKIKALVDALKINIYDRDHFFLIDDSRSMAKFVPLIREALQELFVITKDLDPDKVELAFASAPSNITKTSRRVKKLLRAVEKNPFRREPDMLEFFPRFLDEVIKPRLPRTVCGFNINLKARFKGRKQTSIYIFTDGNWGDGAGPGGGLKEPLEALIQNMQKRGLNKQHVSFHFVRFGDSADGKGYLGHLDHFGKSMDGWDIVDVKDLSNAEVHTIIIGPLSQENDMLGEESD